MTNLFELTYQVAEKLGNLREGTATGGSATTIVDTSRTEDLDYFNGGTAWIIKSTDGLSPQGKYAVVGDYDNDSKTITIANVTDVVQAGDIYAVSNSRFPLWLLIQKINRRVRSLGLLPTVDTSLVIGDNQREYTLPQAASLDLLQVHWSDNQDDPTKGNWIPVLNWDIKYSGVGVAETLVLTYDLPSGHTLKLDYASIHSEMRAYTDQLNEVVHPDLVVFDAAADCLTWYMDKTRLKDFVQTRDDLRSEAAFARLIRPFPQLPQRQSKLGLPGVWNANSDWL